MDDAGGDAPRTYQSGVEYIALHPQYLKSGWHCMHYLVS